MRFFLILILLFSFGYAERIEHQPKALEKALHLPHSGVLKQTHNGFVYLDVSNEFIASLAPLLDLEGSFCPNPTKSHSIGAHISVFYAKEKVSPRELGQSFSFAVQEIKSFTLHKKDGAKKLWILSVHCPELENLREKYGCSPRFQGHDFHITLGKQLPVAKGNTLDVFSQWNASLEPYEGLSSKGDFVVLDAPKILSSIDLLEKSGRLCVKQNGFVYLKADDSFIEKIWFQLPLEHPFDPTPTGFHTMGAHISVIDENEMIEKEIWNLWEAGERFTFEVKELRYVEKKTKEGRIRLWLLAVESPGLERLRMHYGLKPKLHGHDFHITLGSEYIEEKAA